CEAGSQAAATTSIESSVINSKSDDKNAMSDWKTFTKYGFEFRYPSEWIVKDFEGMMRYGFILSDDTLLFTPRRISPKDSIRINFSLMDNTANNYTLDKLAGCINSDTQIILECKDININGVSYKKVIAKHSSSEVGGLPINLDKKSIKVVTVFDNKSLLVEATLNDKDPLDEKVILAKFDSILPTFRFTK
ncbi:MAG: hypothetical protein KGI39_03415, partial [Patescibacteria group bacterium]|nr:hypothetical protein [Patescibacteria group bacterium]